MVWDWYVLRAGPMLIYWLKLLYLFLSNTIFPFLFFRNIGLYCGAGVFGLRGCTYITKVQEHDLYLNQILHNFDLNFFPRMNNKNFKKGGPHGHGAPLLFLYEVSIVVLIDFRAILLTPGNFLI